ncbi:MAG: chromosome partitioning protein ParB [Sphingomonadales bacterium]|nr:chromosome partitioning protein ParB [Sphingomonadales bacterium]
MAMSNPIEPLLHPVAIRDLRPTQMTVGIFEVEQKRAEWRARQQRDGGKFLGGHMIPVVIGPGKEHWVIDHHHLARALEDEGVEHVLVSVVARLDHLPKKRFFAFMDSHNWLHPYDAEGRRCDWKDLPRRVGKLIDDPYRSLAGKVRQAGGCAKSPSPYAEFLWADFFRDRIARDRVERAMGKAVDKAIILARSPAASYLPGFSGPDGGGDGD